VALIKKIGILVSDIDFKINERVQGASFKNANYLKRSFCILELYAAVAGGAKLLCNTGRSSQDLELVLEDRIPNSECQP
jgi:hypothetical protein